MFAELMRLAEVVEPDQEGWTRRAFSPAYRASRAHVAALMEGAGLRVTADPAGNLLGQLECQDPELPALVLGSHTDTVRGGGRFDGMVGVVGAIDVARRLTEAAVRPLRPLWVVDFLGEEPNAFGVSCVGSRAVAGNLGDEQLEREDGHGHTLSEALAEAGGSPERLAAARWDPRRLAGYLELHVEQGPLLERAGIDLGVVTAIAGIHRAEVTLRGRADHAGTTPMDQRHDALLAAAEVALEVEGIARRAPQGVATVGRLEIEPNSANVVAERADMVVEYRSADAGWLAQFDSRLADLIAEVPGHRGVQGSLSWLSREQPTVCSDDLSSALRRAAARAGREPLDLPSGAGHDAVQVAALCPVAMLFVPSRGGRSHCPEEWTEPDHVELGTRTLFEAAAELLSR